MEKNRPKKPEWLYELLPWIYAASGLLVLAIFRNGPGAFSGSTLIAAAAIVLRMRVLSRRDNQPAAGLARKSSTKRAG
jgi:hypothetical protein